MWIITGGTGFIGSQMVSEINSKGLTHILLVDLVPPEQRVQTLKNCQYSQFVEAFTFLDQIQSHSQPFSQQPIEGVIHLGANSSTTESDWELLNKVNLEYSKKIWEFCTHKQIPLVYASSAATYGGGEKGYSDQLNPSELKTLNLYGESKRLFDDWVGKQTSTPPHWYGLKFFNVYGPGEYHKQAMSSVVYKAFEQISETGYLKLFKSHNSNYQDGEQKRDFVYVKDVTRWIWELFEKKPASGIYNMGFGQARTWNDLAKATFDAMKKPLSIEYIEIPSHIRDQYQYFTQADMSKWQQIGLSQPQWDLSRGVLDYIHNHLQR